MQKKDSVFIPIIISLSIIIPVAVAALMIFSNYLHISSTNDFSYLPLFHAILNGTTCDDITCIKKPKYRL